MSEQDDTRPSDAPETAAERGKASLAPLPPRAPASEPVSWKARLKSLDLNAMLGENLGIDLRSLGMFRIAMGVLVLSDLWHRSLHLTAHYTDDGLMPRNKLLGGWSNELNYSFHNWGGTVTSQVILFVVTAVFAAMLVLGYKTRLASIMCFVMVASVQSRNYLILQGGDDLIRVMLFWAMFLPLNARYSIDRALAADAPEPEPKRIFSVASMAICLQLLVMYTVSALLKTGPAWHAKGSAIHLALHHNAFATSFGIWFRELPAPLLQYMTWGVFYLEMLGPLLFFVPFKSAWARTLQTLAFIGFHFGLYLTMELGHFVWVAMGAWLIMFPSWFWDVPVRAFLVKVGLAGEFEELSSRMSRFIAKHRDWFRVRESEVLRIRPTSVGSLLALVLALYAAYGTVYSTTHRGEGTDDHLDPLLQLRLNANWGMFAPNPPNQSGWFVMVGDRKDGTEVDVWNRVSPVRWEKPKVPSRTYRSQRWRKFLDNILNERHAVVRPFFLKWLCQDYNRRQKPERQVRSITMYHMTQTTNFPEKSYTPPKQNQILKQSCPAVPSRR